jgi:putative aldouronate transport system permease protein
MRMAKRSYIRTGGKTFEAVNTLIMIVIIVVTLYPFLNVLALSFNDSKDTVRGGITIYPRAPTLKNYQTIVTFGNIPHAFFISVLRTSLGTLTSLIACAMLAFVLNRKDFQARRILSRFLAITLYVSGGLIPSFWCATWD